MNIESPTGKLEKDLKMKKSNKSKLQSWTCYIHKPKHTIKLYGEDIKSSIRTYVQSTWWWVATTYIEYYIENNKYFCNIQDARLKNMQSNFPLQEISKCEILNFNPKDEKWSESEEVKV